MIRKAGMNFQTAIADQKNKEERNKIVVSLLNEVQTAIENSKYSLETLFFKFDEK